MNRRIYKSLMAHATRKYNRHHHSSLSVADFVVEKYAKDAEQKAIYQCLQILVVLGAMLLLFYVGFLAAKYHIAWHI